MRKRWSLGTTVVLLVMLSSCSLGYGGDGLDAAPPTGYGGLVLRLGPDAPPGTTGSSAPPSVLLRVESPGASQEVTATVNEPVRLLLPPGVYTIKAADGRACTTGVRVDEHATVSEPLLYPASGCEDASGPPARPSVPGAAGPPAPTAPPSAIG